MKTTNAIDEDNTTKLRALGASAYPEIRQLILDHDRASHEYNRLQREGGLWTRAYREYNSLVVRLGNAKKQACKEFATARGWKHLDCKYFSLDQLRTGRTRRRPEDYEGDVRGCIDHPDFFAAGGRPVAIVSHTYDLLPSCIDFAKKERLGLEVLPGSWYFPGGCLGLVLTRLETQSADVKSREAAA
jgi:hypothetical protein